MPGTALKRVIYPGGYQRVIATCSRNPVSHFPPPLT